MDVDNEMLITLVFDKPPVWDKRHSFHGNRNVTDKCWKEISLEMKIEENKLRKRWRYLRDQFAVEFGKMPPSHSGDEAISVYPKWPYFKSLLFLKDIVKPRMSSGNTIRPRPVASVDREAGRNDDTLDSQSINDNDFTPSPPMPMSQNDDDESGQSTRPRKNPKNSYADKIVEIQQLKLKYLQDKQKSRAFLSASMEEEENLLFFKSLLPHIKKIPHHMLLSFRNRIQDVVQEFAYRSHYNNLYDHSAPETYHQRTFAAQSSGVEAPASGTTQNFVDNPVVKSENTPNAKCVSEV